MNMIISFFTRNDVRTNIERTAILYMLAGASNLLWFPALFGHRETVMFFVELNRYYTGYIAVLVWTLMATVSLYLIYIGWSMRLLLSSEKITMSYLNFVSFEYAVSLLCLGIIADLGSLLLLRFGGFGDEVGAWTVIVSIWMGLRVLQANLMAIQAYHQK